MTPKTGSREGHGESFLEGPHLYLRALRPADVTDDYERWMNDPDVTRYTESRFHPWSREQLERYVRDVTTNRDYAFFAIVLRRGQRHIGNIKLGPISWIHRFADIGIIIGDRPSWGRGLAAEAIGLVTEYAFQQLNLLKVTAGCYAPNVGALKTFKKAGFEEEGVRKAHYYCDGSWVDAIYLARRRAEESAR